jgi:predicted negative regulator of RcsB-dependent stress response
VATYADQQEIETLKAWWKNYGSALIVGVVLGTTLLFGIKFWRQHLEQLRFQASDLYAQMEQAGREKRLDTMRDLGARLENDYSGTPYAGVAALLLAQAYHNAGNADEAQKQLQWALDHGRDGAVTNAARLRLARLLLAGGKNEAALAMLETKDKDGFTSEYDALRGDVLLALNRRDEARAAYQAALAASGQGEGRAVLAMKLDDLGPETGK